MTRYSITMFFLLLIHLAYGQNEVIGLKQYKISFVLPSDWIIIQEIPNPANNNLYFLRIKTLRNNSYHDYINVVIRIDNCKTEFLKDKMNDRGVIKLDSVIIDGKIGTRIFGENIGVIDENSTSKIFVYSIDWSIQLKINQFLSIMGTYFSESKSELEQLKTELVSGIQLIKFN